MAIIVGDLKNKFQRLAVLIDADNAQASFMDAIFAKILSLGNIALRRIYGDFTSQRNSSWKSVLQRNAIKPIQQFAYTTGKNATDFAMVIDAMDLLYTRKYDGYCLISSDSDFTSLAIRLREEGITVFGFGEKKTPEPFRNACNQFIFTELLRAGLSVGNFMPGPPSGQAIDFPEKLVLRALEDAADVTGWAYIGAFGNKLAKIQSGFNSKLFGYKKLSDFVKARPELFILEERSNEGTNQKLLYLRER